MMMRMHDLIYHRLAYEKQHCEFYIDCYHNGNPRSVICAFMTTDEVKIHFTFKFGYDNRDKKSSSNNRRIKFLHILLMQ